MPVDYPALQIRTPNAFETIGNLVNTARGLTALQREKGTLEADIARSKAESSRAQTEAGVAAETAQPRVEKAASEASTAATGATSAKFKLEGEYASKAMQIAGGLIQDPRIAKSDPEGIVQAGEEAYGQMVAAGIPKTQARFWASQVQATAHNPGATAQLLRNITRANAGSGTQAGVINAPTTMVNTGQQQVPTQMQPGAEGFTGQPVQNQLPPGTPVYGPDNTPRYLGPVTSNIQAPPADAMRLISGIKDPAERAQAAQAYLEQMSRGAGGPQAGPSPSVAGTIATNVDTMHQDYGENAIRASGAQQNIGVLENIKKYAKGAITGVESDRRAYLVGLVGLLGGDKAQAEKTATDVLQKNATMLAQQGGHTDAERMLVSAMNPNAHMTPEAIAKAADQVIAQQQLPLARQKYLQQFTRDPAKYNAEMAEFNRHADPRVLQFKSMTKDERAELHASMSKDQWRAFTENGKWFEAKGLY